MKLRKWQVEYLDRMSKMTNSELLREYIYYEGGDDYDGCRTDKGQWCLDQLTPELEKRLKESGFLQPEDEL